MKDLIGIKPTVKLQFECLFCQSEETEVKEIIYQGVHVIADCVCLSCKKMFYHTLPIGHDKLFSLAFDKEGREKSNSKKEAEWLVKPLFEAFFKYPKEEAEIEKKVFFKKEGAIILNCLDSCYGHVLTKLWNAKLLMDVYPELSTIVLIPKNVEWLVPTGVAEIWTVEAPLNRLKYYIARLDSFIKKETSRFKTVYLSPAYVHLDTFKVSIDSFVKRKPFNLAEFNSSAPQITFVIRNDRFWHGNNIEFTFFKVCVKFKLLNFFRKLFLWRQNQLFNKFARAISRQLPGVKLFASGIGKPRGLSSLIRDHRSEKISAITEMEWCELYANSHIIIGVHGSNMLIPTSLGAGFIELLPRYKIPHITEDLVLKYSSRYSVFLGRHLDLYSSVKLVVLHAVSMIRDFPLLYKNSEQRYGDT